MIRFVVGDLLTGRRIQTVPALSGRWSDVLNRAGEVSCTVTLTDPAVRRLRLAQSAIPGKSFLAAIDGNTVLQAGPIWEHEFSSDTNHLTLIGSGMWSYFDHRTLLPAGTTNPDGADTNLVKSLQGIARFYVEQALSWDSGDVPVLLPDEEPGSNVRNEAGINLAWIGQRLSDMTRLENGPDIRFSARVTADMQGLEWPMLIGTTEQPQLYSPQDVVFNVGVPRSSVSNLQVRTSAGRLASHGWATGGRGADTTIFGVAVDSSLTDAGFPMLEAIDSSHSTVSEQATIDGYARELVTRGRVPIRSVSFDHDYSQRPYLEAFNVGDFASVRIRNNSYLEDGMFRMRITSRSGTPESHKVHVELQPEEA